MSAVAHYETCPSRIGGPCDCPAGEDRYAIRIHGRGVVTTFNDEPIIGLAEAERVAAIVTENLGESCAIEKLLLSIPAASVAGSSADRKETK